MGGGVGGRRVVRGNGRGSGGGMEEKEGGDNVEGWREGRGRERSARGERKDR